MFVSEKSREQIQSYEYYYGLLIYVFIYIYNSSRTVLIQRSEYSTCTSFTSGKDLLSTICLPTQIFHVDTDSMLKGRAVVCCTIGAFLHNLVGL